MRRRAKHIREGQARERKKEGKPAYFGAHVKRTWFRKTGLVKSKKATGRSFLNLRTCIISIPVNGDCLPTRIITGMSCIACRTHCSTWCAHHSIHVPPSTAHTSWPIPESGWASRTGMYMYRYYVCTSVLVCQSVCYMYALCTCLNTACKPQTHCPGV